MCTVFVYLHSLLDFIYNLLFGYLEGKPERLVHGFYHKSGLYTVAQQ